MFDRFASRAVGCTSSDVRYVAAMEERKFISAADMDRMTPNERADAVNASICHSWDEVPEPFRTQVLETARELAQRFGYES